MNEELLYALTDGHRGVGRVLMNEELLYALTDSQRRGGRFLTSEALLYALTMVLLVCGRPGRAHGVGMRT